MTQTCEYIIIYTLAPTESNHRDGPMNHKHPLGVYTRVFSHF